jgi:26S proteasome regulatory subunit N3
MRQTISLRATCTTLAGKISRSVILTCGKKLTFDYRIKAVQLEYTDAFRCLQQASRKAPQQSALGYVAVVCARSIVLLIFARIRFRKTVYKFSIIVQLLLGEIPDRSIFSQKVEPDVLILH